MYTTKTYKTDLELQCSDGVSLFHSKYVLSEKSPYIDGLLSSCEPDTNKIDVEYPSIVVSNILLCIDEKKIKKTTTEQKLQMYTMAHKWNIKSIEDSLAYSMIKTITSEQLSVFKQLKTKQYNKAMIQYAINVYYSKDKNSPQDDVIRTLMKIVLYAIYNKTPYTFPSTELSFNDPFVNSIKKLMTEKEEVIPVDSVIDTLQRFCDLI